MVFGRSRPAPTSWPHAEWWSAFVSLWSKSRGILSYNQVPFFWWRNIFPCEAKKGSDVSRSLSVALAWRCCKLLFGISPWPNCQALNRTKHLFFLSCWNSWYTLVRNHFSGVAPCARLRKECNCCWSLPSWFGNPLDGIVECVGGTFRNSHLFHRTYD